jgi:hypothetical protein
MWVCNHGRIDITFDGVETSKLKNDFADNTMHFEKEFTETELR